MSNYLFLSVVNVSKRSGTQSSNACTVASNGELLPFRFCISTEKNIAMVFASLCKALFRPRTRYFSFFLNNVEQRYSRNFSAKKKNNYKDVALTTRHIVARVQTVFYVRTHTASEKNCCHMCWIISILLDERATNFKTSRSLGHWILFEIYADIDKAQLQTHKNRNFIRLKRQIYLSNQKLLVLQVKREHCRRRRFRQRKQVIVANFYLVLWEIHVCVSLCTTKTFFRILYNFLSCFDGRKSSFIDN